ERFRDRTLEIMGRRTVPVTQGAPDTTPARPTDSRPNMRLSPGSNSTSVWGFSPFTVNAQTRDGPTVSRQASRSGWTATIARSRDRTIVVEGKRGRRGGRRNLGNASRAEL